MNSVAVGILLSWLATL